MKKAIILVIVALFTVISVNAQTSARPGKPTAAGHAIKTLGRFTDESVEIKSDGKGSLDYWRLTGLSINAAVGMEKDGINYNAGLAYRLRIPKAPWTRCFIFGVNIGQKTLNVDGLKNLSLYGEGTVMVDLMTLIAPKSRVILNVGGGYSYTKVSYQAQYNIENQYEVNHNYSASSGGPVVKAEVGYSFDRRFDLSVGGSYNAFSVDRSPLDKFNYGSGGVYIKLSVNLGRK